MGKEKGRKNKIKIKKAGETKEFDREIDGIVPGVNCSELDFISRMR